MQCYKLKSLRGLGGLLFIYGSSTGAYLLMLYLAFISPMIYDFYNYHIEEPEFFQDFAMFTQNLALFGALLFFIGLNNGMQKRQPKKKGIPRVKEAA
ncbi:putative HR-like lesion-inducer [Dioscorea sansibarensis]